jgi:hypothetical protein
MYILSEILDVLIGCSQYPLVVSEAQLCSTVQSALGGRVVEICRWNERKLLAQENRVWSHVIGPRFNPTLHPHLHHANIDRTL